MQIVRTVTLLIVIAWIVTFHIGERIDRIVHWIGKDHLTKVNEAYLDEASDEALATFMVLSALKAGLAAVESSSAGFSFIVDVQVQVGRFVHSMKKLVDYGWNASLLGLATITFFRMLLTISNAACPYFVDMLLVALVIYIYFEHTVRKPARWMVEVVRYMSFLALLSYLIIPLAVHAASFASKSLTIPGAQEIREQIRDKHQHLLSTHEEGDVNDHAHTGIKGYEHTVKGLPDQHSHLSGQMSRYMVHVLFDVIVFPVGFLIALALPFRRLSNELTSALLVRIERKQSKKALQQA